MSISKKQLETLKQKVILAFANVPYPESDLVRHECEECRDIRKAFTNLDWKTIDSKLLEENFGSLSFFSPEAFHFFLPAYLVYSLEHFEDDFNEVPEFTTYTLTPDKEIKENPGWWQERFENFTKEQFNLIYDFLDLAKSNEEFDEFITSIIRGKERLKEFVEPTLKN